MRKEFVILVFAFMVLISLQNFAVANAYDQSAYEHIYGSPVVHTSYPNLIVSVLKYEEYPVISGDWFDLWVKVQNSGEEDSLNTVFKLEPEYPFVSNDSLTRYYGLVYGTANSYKVDQTYDSSQVVLKYRVRVEDNAPSGTSELKFKVSTNNFTTSRTYDLPIEIFSAKNNPITPIATSEPTYLKWTYGAIGLIVGAFIIIFAILIKQRRKSKHHSR